jgi:biopolymer transport protein ExbD
VAETEMDMTPMIDVVFQLLIFFMCATKFRTLDGRLLAYLPKNQGRPCTPNEIPKLPARVTLHWNVATQQAKVYVGQTFTGLADQGGLQRARDAVRRIKATGTDKAEIDAAPDIPYRYVVETLDMLIGVAMTDIAFAAARPS